MADAPSLAALAALGLALPMSPGEDFFALRVFALEDLTGDGIADLAVVDPGRRVREPEPEGSVWILSGRDRTVLERRTTELGYGHLARPLLRDGALCFLTVQGAGGAPRPSEPANSPWLRLLVDYRYDLATAVLPDTLRAWDDDVLLLDAADGGLPRIARLSGRDLAPVWCWNVADRPAACSLTVPARLDLDGDSVPDLAIAYAARDLLPRDPGGEVRIEVLSGASGQVLAGRTVPVDGASAASPPSLTPLGDVDGDGHPDLLVHAAATLVRASGDFVAVSSATGAELYRFQAQSGRVGAIGDVSCDGVADFVLQRTVGTGVDVHSGADAEWLYRIPGPEDAWGLGSDVAALADLNDDGVPDYVLADQQPGCGWPGSFAVISGREGTILNRVWRRDLVPSDTDAR